MSLEKTQHEALTKVELGRSPSLDQNPLVIRYAAFEISSAAFGELTSILRTHGYHHAIDDKKNCILANMMAFTRRSE